MTRSLRHSGLKQGADLAALDRRSVGLVRWADDVSKHHDDRTQASEPGRLRLARHRLAMWSRTSSIVADLKRWIVGDTFAEMLDEHLHLGDSRAAVVISSSPLLIAAYTDELDCVAILKFPSSFADRFGLGEGTRLLTVNTYSVLPEVVPDLIPGSGDLHRYQNFFPLIAEFLSEESERITTRKAEIAQPEWERCLWLGQQYIRLRPGVTRDGSPFASAKPAGTNPKLH